MTPRNIKVGRVSELGLDSKQVADFYRDNWVRKIALSDEKFYEWQFKSVPIANGLDQCVVAYDEGSAEVLGVMGLNDRRFTIGGKSRLGAELTTWIVGKELQGSGVGPKILSKIQDEYDVLIGMGISDMALPIYMRSGFRYLRAIPRFTKVLDLDAVKSVATYNPMARKLIATWGRSEELSCRVESGVEGVEALNARMADRLNFFSRDVQHLIWRYQNHPYFDYKTFLLTLPDGGHQAFVCFREETSVEGLRMLHMVDCYGDEEAMPVALSFAETYGRQNSFHVIDFFCTAAAVNKYFLAGGWFSTMDDLCFQMPHLFHPVELRNPPTTSLVYWSRDDMVEMCDLSKLYITKQDADFDRPTLA